MASRQDEFDANEPATPFKLEKARERGSVVRSAEVNFAVVLVACVACLEGLGPRLLERGSRVLGAALSAATTASLDPREALILLVRDGSTAAALVAPIVFVIWVSATLAGAVQAGGVLTTAPLAPDFSRLGPAAGFKQLFSRRSLNELWRSVLKLVVVGGAMGVWASAHLGAILSVSHLATAALASAGVELIASALTLLAALAIAFAAMDWGLNRLSYLRRMRMSKREIKDERKERDGDPRIKTRLRELRLQWLQRSRELRRVSSADVLLTNPTHFAVALEYRSGEMVAPTVTARGAGELAQRMRWLARLHGVPIVENPSLARALFRSKEAGSVIPERHFHDVARILRWVYAARPRRASGAAR